MRKKPLPIDALKKAFVYNDESGLIFWAKTGKEAGDINDAGYRRVCLNQQRYMAHRVVWCLVYGEEPNEIDHIDGDRSNNKIENLRSVSYKENHRNLKKSVLNTSGHLGVTWHSRKGKWMSSITVDNQCIHIGYYSVKTDAIAARKAAEIRYSFHPNHGRNLCRF